MLLWDILECIKLTTQKNNSLFSRYLKRLFIENIHKWLKQLY